MLVSDFDFELPAELIAQEPSPERGGSRMLVVSRTEQTITDDYFANLPQFLRPGDCLVLNNTRVFPARLHGNRNNRKGAGVEVFLLRSQGMDGDIWKALVRPGKRVQPGDTIQFAGSVYAEVIAAGEYGERMLRFHADELLSAVFERLGSVPLPPYIHREPSSADRHRYQTVFAKKEGSVAAPTAGLHFTGGMLEGCEAAGASLAYVTLHVGLGTFAPLREKAVAQIELHEEYFEIEAAAARQIRAAERVLCVGTTSVRALETAVRRGGIAEMQGETNLFISPGFHFGATGAMLTNFHLPQSSLLILVSAFGGKDLILRAYRHAVAERYRFFSYGDCMLIV